MIELNVKQIVAKQKFAKQLARPEKSAPAHMPSSEESSSG